MTDLDLIFEMLAEGYPGYYEDPHNTARVVRVAAVHRTLGSVPNCQPAPHDATLLETLGISPESTAGAFCADMADAVKSMRASRLGLTLDDVFLSLAA